NPPSAPSLMMWATAGVVLLLMVWLALVLRGQRRRRLRSAFGLYLAWGLGAIVWTIPGVSPGVRAWCEIVSLVSLSLAAIRVGWVLVVDWGLNDGAALGLSQISRDLIQAALYIIATITAARAAGADARSLATTGGLVTAGLTFSLQQTLGDLVAGLLLQ